MSTLTYSQSGFIKPSTDEKVAAPARPSLWRRMLERLIESRRRRADREIAAFIARRGGHLTDELERDLMRELTRSNRFTQF